MRILIGYLGRILSGTLFFLPVAAAGVQCLAAGPGDWQLLSRFQVNPPEVQSFVETLLFVQSVESGSRWKSGSRLYCGSQSESKKGHGRLRVPLPPLGESLDSTGSHCREQRP